MAIDPVTTTLLVINGGLLLGNVLLYLTSPTRNQLIASDIKSREKLPDAVIAAAQADGLSEVKAKPFSVQSTEAPRALVPENADATAKPEGQAPENARGTQRKPVEDLRLARVERRLDSGTTRINSVEERLTESVDGLTARVSAHDSRFESFGEQLKVFASENLAQKLGKLEGIQRELKELKARTPRNSAIAAVLDAKFREIDARLSSVRNLSRKREARLLEPGNVNAEKALQELQERIAVPA